MIDLRFRILKHPDRRLAELKQGMRNRILRKAVRAASREVIKAIKKLAPKLSGTLRASIGVRIATSRKTGSLYAVIGPRRRFQRKRKGKVESVGRPTKYAHLVERGTRPHSTHPGDRLGRRRVNKKTGKVTITPFRQTTHKLNPGAKAHPFMVPARRELRAAAKKMRETIRAELAKPALTDGG